VTIPKREVPSLQFHAFVSYADEDRSIAQEVVRAIESAGGRCWIAPRDVPLGAAWASAIVEAIANSRMMVLVLSRNANASRFVLMEVTQAASKGLPVVTLRVENVEPIPGLALLTGHVHRLDAFEAPLSKHLPGLVSAIVEPHRSPPPGAAISQASRPGSAPALAFIPRVGWGRLCIFGLLTIVAVALVVLGGQHVDVVSSRYPSGEVLVPAGEFRPSIDDSPLLSLLRKLTDVGDIDILLAPPPTEAVLPNFLIDRTEVTNADYGKYLAEQRVQAVREPAFWKDARFNQPGQPVVGVDWAAADAFCRSRGKRLPSGNEHERAARGRDGRLYPWGNTFDGSAANTREGPLPGPAPVGSYSRDVTQEGVADLAGNAREWTADPAPQRDNGATYFVRGASFVSRGDIFALGFLAMPTDATRRDPDLGFRCAADADPLGKIPAGMIQIDGGSFHKGSEDQRLINLARKLNINGASLHQLVALPELAGPGAEFAIDKTAVTNADYRRFLEADVSTNKPPDAPGKDSLQPSNSTWDDPRFNRPRQPVVGVTWAQADAYCRWLGRRLPTAREWERAVAGATNARYPWGDNWDPQRCNTADAVSPQGAPADVGEYKSCATPSGILDVVGNADEWTATDMKDPLGRPAKIVHGGSWADAGELRGLVAFRWFAPPGHSGPTVGFRCVSDPKVSWLERIVLSWRGRAGP
jgi:formylglycine-generating enzyme required for sulfatase activity